MFSIKENKCFLDIILDFIDLKVLFHNAGGFFKGWEFLFFPNLLPQKSTEQVQQKSDSVWDSKIYLYPEEMG